MEEDDNRNRRAQRPPTGGTQNDVLRPDRQVAERVVEARTADLAEFVLVGDSFGAVVALAVRAVAECLVDVGLSWLADGDAAAAVASLEQARADALGTEDRYTINSVLIALADANAAAGSSARASALRSEAGVSPD